MLSIPCFHCSSGLVKHYFLGETGTTQDQNTDAGAGEAAIRVKAQDLGLVSVKALALNIMRR